MHLLRRFCDKQSFAISLIYYHDISCISDPSNFSGFYSSFVGEFLLPITTAICLSKAFIQCCDQKTVLLALGDVTKIQLFNCSSQDCDAWPSFNTAAYSIVTHSIEHAHPSPILDPELTSQSNGLSVLSIAAASRDLSQHLIGITHAIK